MGSDLGYKTPCELQAFSLLKHSSHILKWIRVRRMSFCPKPRSRSRMSAPLFDSQNNSGSPLCRIYPETLDRYRHVCFWWFSCLLHHNNLVTRKTWLYEVCDCPLDCIYFIKTLSFSLHGSETLQNCHHGVHDQERSKRAIKKIERLWNVERTELSKTLKAFSQHRMREQCSHCINKAN